MIIPLTKGQHTVIDDSDAETVSMYKWHILNGYAAHNFPNEYVYLHRFIMKPNAGEYIDHINGDTLDNRRLNLRICTQRQNIAAKRMQSNNKSGYIGVFWDKSTNKWGVSVAGRNGGRFYDLQEAIRVRDGLAKAAYGEFARLNR